MTARAIILPTPLQQQTAALLVRAGFAISNVQGRRRPLMVVRGRVPVLTNIVRLRPSGVEAIFRFANRPQ